MGFSGHHDGASPSSTTFIAAPTNGDFYFGQTNGYGGSMHKSDPGLPGMPGMTGMPGSGFVYPHQTFGMGMASMIGQGIGGEQGHVSGAVSHGDNYCLLFYDEQNIRRLTCSCCHNRISTMAISIAMATLVEALSSDMSPSFVRFCSILARPKVCYSFLFFLSFFPSFFSTIYTCLPQHLPFFLKSILIVLLFLFSLISFFLLLLYILLFPTSFRHRLFFDFV